MADPVPKVTREPPRSLRFVAALLLGLSPAAAAQRLPSTAAGERSLGSSGAPAEAVLAGGCFWGVEAVFEHLRGVQSVTSGYARYRALEPSSKAPAPLPAPVEAVRIVYDPSQISYRQLLEVFFMVAHDPTSRDRQGPDAGPAYRAVVLYQLAAERLAADAFMAELGRTTRFARPIVTELQALSGFTLAEAFHQDYAARHPNDPYIVQNDLPKLERLRARFPALYQDRRAP